MTFTRAAAGPIAIGAAVVLGLAVVAGGAITLRLAVAAVVLGAAIGLVAAGLIHARYGGRARGGAARNLLETVALCLAIEGVVVAWGMATTPALYAARWYAKGGLARTAQLLASDTLGAHGVILVAIALALLYVGPRRRVGRARWAVVGALALLVGSWIHAGRTSDAPLAPVTAAAGATKPNVLLVIVEGLRAEGLDPRTAPTLVRLAARGARFDGAYASTPERLPGLATLLTGRYAHHHGLRSEEPPPDALARDLDALPTRFARDGYATAALGDDGAVLRRLDLGFAEVAAPGRDSRDEALARQTPLLPLLATSVGRRFFPAMSGLREARDPRLLADDAARRMHVLKQRPFLLTVTFSTALAPYVAPATYAAKYTDRSYRGRFRYLQSAGAPADEADGAQIRALHDGAVRAVDDGVARLLEALADEEIGASTIVVVTAEPGHTLLGDESLHVPLVVFDPRRGAPIRSDAIVRDVDLAASLYALTSVALPSDLDGRSLVPLLEGKPDQPRLAFSESAPANDPPRAVALPLPAALGPIARHRAVRDERYELVYVPTRKGAAYALFDAVSDPARSHDLAPARPEVVDRLRPALVTWMLSDPGTRLQGDLVVPSKPLPYDLVWITAREMTPGIEALALRGVRFTEVVPSGPPVRREQLPIGEGATVDSPRALVVVSVGGEGWKPSQLVIVAPGKLPAGATITARVSDLDVVPTLSELLGLDLDPPLGSRSLVALANGARETEDRAIMTLRPGARMLVYQDRRLVLDNGVQLYDVRDLALATDLAKREPDRVADLRARLRAALANAPVAGSREPPARPRVVHLRFVTAGSAHRVTGFLDVPNGTLSLEPVELGRDALKVSGSRADLAFTTSADVAVGFDLVVDPPATDVMWSFFLDDRPWLEEAVFGGPHGLLQRSLVGGLGSDAARRAITTAEPPVVDAHRDFGLFLDRK